MIERNSAENYMKQSRQEQRRINHSFDRETLARLVTQSFQSKHQTVVDAQATLFSNAHARATPKGFEFTFLTQNTAGNYSNNTKKIELYSPLFKFNGLDPFEYLVARARAKIYGLDKLADTITENAMTHLAKHEALFVMRGELPRPPGWAALEEKQDLSDETPSTSQTSRRRPGL